MALVQRAIEKTSFGDFLKSDPMLLILHSYNPKNCGLYGIYLLGGPQ